MSYERDLTSFIYSLAKELENTTDPQTRKIYGIILELANAIRNELPNRAARP